MSTPDKKSAKNENEVEGSGGPIVMRPLAKFGEVITPEEAKRRLDEERDPQVAFWGTEDGSHP